MTSSIVHDLDLQKRSISLVSTETTELQEDTELECQPFFVDIKGLRKHAKEHLRETGLLPPANNNHNNSNADEEDPYDLGICLVREKHYTYLSRVFLPSEQPLGYSLVSLDASRPWMLYWTLHGCDLLLLEDEDNDTEMTMTSDASEPPTAAGNLLLFQKVGDSALSAIVSTLEACWQSIEVTLPQHLELSDRDTCSLLESVPDDEMSDATSHQPKYTGGGFGGGPGQMAHCAPTYAAVLTLCIIATSSSSSSSSMAAWKLLERIRKPLYSWYLSLQQSNGGFRMHHDGEIDVRGMYVVYSLIAVVFAILCSCIFG
jgi:prenyltransferase beta subunit